MGSIGTDIVLLSANMNPGDTHTWHWNNPNINYVYALSAATHSSNSQLNQDLKVQISPLRYNYNTGTGKRWIEYDVKNVTQQPLNYEVHMSWASPI
jgi:hypothetical protein